MPSYITVEVAGHLGQDPEVAYGKSGMAYANLSIAVNYKQHEEEKTEWVRATVFGASAEQCAELSKGDLVVIHNASLRTEKWEDQEGVTRWTTKVIGGLLIPGNWKRMSEEGGAAPRKKKATAKPRPQQQQEMLEDDDDIPF